MRTSKSYLFMTFVVVAIILMSGCKKSTVDANSLYTPTDADITASATLLELQQGHTLYINKCGSCHGLYSPDAYAPSQWNSIMSSMAPKSNLSGSENQLISKYVSRGR